MNIDCAICGSTGTKVTAYVCQDCKEAVLLMKDIRYRLVADEGYSQEDIAELFVDALRGG